jgi:uncharacterized protein (UPF0332 family)
MSTTPTQILQVANSIRSLGEEEALLRSAVSRAYYAALLEVSATIPDRDGSTSLKGESSHEKVISKVDVYRRGPNPGRGAAAVVFKYLPAMKRARVKADYHLDDSVTLAECEEVFLRAHEVMTQCQEVSSALTRK